MDHLSRALPPLRALLAFEAAARLGSFTAAARELNVSQPAVSRQVKALEDALGTAVFRREHRRVTLTDAGKIYHDAVVSGFHGILEAGRITARIAAPDRVTIYANYGLASYWLMPRLTRYQEANPDVDIVVRTVELEQDLADSGADIAIRFGAGQWRDGTVRPLFRECCFAVCSPAYLENKDPITSVAALARHRLLKVQSDNQPWLDWAGFFRAFGVTYQVQRSSSYNNYTLAIQAALAGQGIALGWGQISDDFLLRGWLIRPINDVVNTDLGYYTVTAHGADPGGPVGTVLDWLHAEGTAPPEPAQADE